MHRLVGTTGARLAVLAELASSHALSAQSGVHSSIASAQPATTFAASTSAATAGAASRSMQSTMSMTALATSRRFRGPEDSRRLSFEERAERREHRNKQSRGDRLALVAEAEGIANQELPDELQATHDACFARATTSALKITNLQKCLENIEIDMSGRKVPLLQAAQIVKVSPTELHVLPTQAPFLAPMLQKLMRFDSTIHAQKEQNKIKLKIQPVTTQRREQSANEVRAQFAELTAKAKTVRVRMVRALQGLGAPDDSVQQLIDVMDAYIKDFLAERELEYQELESSVMVSGDDESDASIASG